MPRPPHGQLQRIQGIPPSLHEADSWPKGFGGVLRNESFDPDGQDSEEVLRGSPGPGPALGLSEGPVRGSDGVLASYSVFSWICLVVPPIQAGFPSTLLRHRHFSPAC